MNVGDKVIIKPEKSFGMEFWDEIGMTEYEFFYGRIGTITQLGEPFIKVLVQGKEYDMFPNPSCWCPEELEKI